MLRKKGEKGLGWKENKESRAESTQELLTKVSKRLEKKNAQKALCLHEGSVQDNENVSSRDALLGKVEYFENKEEKTKENTIPLWKLMNTLQSF